MKFDFARPRALRRPVGVGRCHGALRRGVFLAMGAVLAFSTALAAAEPPAKGISSRSAKDDALRAVPLDKLNPEAHAKVSTVLKDISIFRRLPIRSVDCDPALFHHLISNPDLVVNIWQLMGVTNVSMDRLGENHFRCADGDGTTCRAEFVHHSHDTHIIYAEGIYDGPLFPRPVRGQCVAVLKTAEIRETNGRFYVSARLDVFLHVDNAGVEILAKMFQGWLGKTIDYNFVETVGFLSTVSHTAETNPQGMRRLVSKLERVEPQRRQQFIAVTDQVAGNLVGVDLASDRRPDEAKRN